MLEALLPVKAKIKEKERVNEFNNLAWMLSWEFGTSNQVKMKHCILGNTKHSP